LGFATMSDASDSSSFGPPRYKRVLLKLSGESFQGTSGKSGISIEETVAFAQQLKRVA
jgi:uridylate kinase